MDCYKIKRWDITLIYETKMRLKEATQEYWLICYAYYQRPGAREQCVGDALTSLSDIQSSFVSRPRVIASSVRLANQIIIDGPRRSKSKNKKTAIDGQDSKLLQFAPIPKPVKRVRTKRIA